jgi:phage shock protein C
MSRRHCRRRERERDYDYRPDHAGQPEEAHDDARAREQRGSAGPWHAGAPHGWSRRNPHRLYRDRENRRIMGVCAGIADYFGIDALPLRIAFLVGAFFFPFPIIPGYFVLGLLLKKRPRELYSSREEERLWREVTVAPDRSFYALRLKFSELEARLARLEADVTSGEFELRRQFRDLGV